jgi:hypothetical protein
VVLHHSRAAVDAGSRGYELLLEHGRVAFGLHYLWPGASLKIATKAALPAGAWSQVSVTYDGSSRATGARIYVDGRLAETEVIQDGLDRDITYDKTEPDLAIGFRFRDSGFKGGRVRELFVFDRTLTELEAAQLAGRGDLAEAWACAPDQLTAVQRAALFEYFLAEVHPPVRAAMTTLQALREQQNALLKSVPDAMVMQELPVPKPAFVLAIAARTMRRERRESGYARGLAAFPGQSAAQSTRPRPLAHRRRQPTARPCDRKPALANDVWSRARRNLR